MATLQGEDVEMSQNTTDEEFLTVSRQSRKRKQTANLMDTSDIEMKRPHLPPISGDKLKVYHAVIFVNCRSGQYKNYSNNCRWWPGCQSARHMANWSHETSLLCDESGPSKNRNPLNMRKEVSIHRASPVWFVHWLAIHRASPVPIYAIWLYTGLDRTYYSFVFL